MSSPPPIDPYLALGISKDADLSTIRSAHRKLVLKFHPDRIKDEAERVKGREEFQKVQQAYELLSDPAKRSRYDDKVRLAELRKEALGRELPVRSSTYPTRPSQFSAGGEYRGGDYYEERVPRGAAFFDEEDRFREEPSRASARKAENYERKPSGGYVERKSTGWKAGGIPIEIALKLQKQAALAKEKIKEKDVRAATAKSRDQERKRDASDKHNSRRAYVEDDSNSDTDTETYVSVNRKAAKARSASSTPRRSRPEHPRRKESKYSDDDDDDDWSRDKHQAWHASARDYIQKAAPDRPRQTHRQDSSHSYFEPRDDRPYARRSGSDREDRRNERDRPKVSSSTRPSYPEVEVPRDVRSRKMPAMPTATSAPANIKIPEDRRDVPQPHRSTTTQAVRDHRNAVPTMPRSQTMPSGASARRSDNAPSRGSNLKHETHDSGYGSSSPATPDTIGTSPPKYASAIRYQIVDEAEEFSTRGHRTIRVDPEESRRRAKSPPVEPQRPTLSMSGKRPSRAATAYTPHSPVDVPPARPSPSRHESSRMSAQPREPPRLARGVSSQRGVQNLYREISPNGQESSYKPRVSSEKVASARTRTQDGTHSPLYSRAPRDAGRDDDHYPGSSYRSELRNPGMGTRRPSVY
ncbi:hypothetical protein EPUS_08415 [Endocarpon pusillum Z07020]|uniref:J domain-containing protein n=1 Tax=Endocarpon pusillum (strain Z07020 / HMAS-L-300199) TaxID=1263415 RepID=U1GJL2_ENDPU|nr:uncharacterized protein EPUS_08415 [Endocarpon pusillum Z07020]ERF72021.1 hypothetical protein EPUS_08415 [Endocarpon pusillum Z07020]